MLCNYGYDVERCFDCPYGNGSHIPEDFEGWSDTVIKDTMVTNKAAQDPKGCVKCFFGHFEASEQTENTTLTFYNMLANSCLFPHPADTEKHDHPV